MINPKITKLSYGQEIQEEGCLSVVDENGIGIMVNRAYTRITGMTEEQVLKKPATVDIAEGESMHLKVLKTKRPVNDVRMKVGPARKDVIVDVAPIIVDGKLNGSVGETFFQFDDFITSGDNAVLTLKNEYNPYLLFYISVMIKNHQWRYNYYRKLNLTKLKKMNIPMPFKNAEELDLEYIENIVENSYGFDELRKYL